MKGMKKEKILEAWIMVEHLSEGDISDRDAVHPDAPENNDYYSLFKNEMEKKGVMKKKKGGIAVYFDIFNFSKVVDILRDKYKLPKPEEEQRTGNKFGFVLYFDKQMKLLHDMTFYTESEYIKTNEEVPLEDEFRSYENEMKLKLKEMFEETSEAPDKFNKAVAGVFKRYNVKEDDIRLRAINDLETDAANLHSFFIGDLEKAKEISTYNLEQYLFGDDSGRVDLDSTKTSPKFDPEAFEDILQPKNYPLGRFPSNTEYALSLMQQVAVNLAAGYDSKTIRSVNGPPGTGKTTLLKDIFAELVVRQGFEMAQMSSRFIAGTEETVYFKRASIGVLPESITENSIVVASSNNGAVQNIVNELPVIKDKIDEKLISELTDADYFYKIANEPDEEEGEAAGIDEIRDDAEELWGTFSLEGGRADNMKRISSVLKRIYEYFENEYESDPDAYDDFMEQYNKVKALRDKAQRYADNVKLYRKSFAELENARASYNAEYESRKAALEAQEAQINREVAKFREELADTEALMEEIKERREKINANRQDVEMYKKMLEDSKPGLFAPAALKKEYSEQMNDAAKRFKTVIENSESCDRYEESASNRMRAIKSSINGNLKKLEALKSQFEAWADSERYLLNAREQKTNGYLSGAENCGAPLDMNMDYDKLHLSNPWFDESYRVEQSRLFIKALAVRRQFLYENRRNINAAQNIWTFQNQHIENKKLIEAAWGWINLTVPVISSTFASFGSMCRNLGVNTLGHLFIDEAGQAVPQAAVGAVFRSRHVMVVGDPSQIKPVLTVDGSVLAMLGRHFGVSDKYLSDSASAQTLTDAASRYGFYRERDKTEGSWIGIPLWVHRRCKYPMFTISNEISYNGFMVQGNPGNGKTGWFDVKGSAKDKYVEAQGEFLLRKLKKMIDRDPSIIDKKQPDKVYVITPFSNVSYMLARKLNSIGFTRYDKRKATNVGTIHTFQGKEAPIVFMVLGADSNSKGAASWAVSEPNMMNVAATRAKKEFYVIGDRSLYLSLGSDVASTTYKIMSQYKKDNPELIDDDVTSIMGNTAAERADDEVRHTPNSYEKRTAQKINAQQTTNANVRQTPNANVRQSTNVQRPLANANARSGRVSGRITYVGQGKTAPYAYAAGNDGKSYTITETIYKQTENAASVIVKGRQISFVPAEGQKNPLATDIKPV